MFHTEYDASSSTWFGQMRAPMYHPDVSVAQVLLDALHRRPAHIGQISENNGLRLVNRVLRLNAIRVAQHLDRMGVGAGDVIGTVAKNHHDLAAVVVGSLALAAPINALESTFETGKQAEIVHMFRLTQPKIVFCDPDNIAAVREALRTLNATVPCFTFGAKVDGARMVNDLLEDTGDEELFLPRKLSDGRKQTAAIVCSTGSSGEPMGICISHALLLDQASKALSLTADDVLLNFSSIYCPTGLISMVSGILRALTRIISTQPFSAALMLRTIQKYRVSVTTIAPSHLVQLLQCAALNKANLSSLQRFYVDGLSTVVPDELCQRLNRHLPADVRAVYSKCEIGPIATHEQLPFKAGSVGKLAAGMSVQIRDEADGRCGPNEDGELCVRIDPPYTGYWMDAAATAQLFDADGWMRTGDLGHFDEDGHLFVINRKADMLNCGGQQIAPAELENLVLRTQLVAAVCVVGIPDAIAGELPAAVIVRGGTNAMDLSEPEIGELVRANLMRDSSKQLQGGVYIVDGLPTTYTGAVMRDKVKEIAIERFNERSQNSSFL